MTGIGRYLFPLGFLSVLTYFLVQVRGILLPFILGAVVAYLLNPVIRFFEVRGLRREPIVIFLFSGLLLILGGAIYAAGSIASQEAAKAAAKMPDYVRRGQAFYQSLTKPAAAGQSGGLQSFPILQQLSESTPLVDQMMAKARHWPAAVLEKMPSLAGHLLPLIQLAVLVPFIAFFLMLEGPLLIHWFFACVPARYVEMSLNILVEIDNSLGDYLRGLCLEACAVGLIAYGGFWLIDLDYGLQIAVVVGLANLIPLVGPHRGRHIRRSGGALSVGKLHRPFESVCRLRRSSLH